MSVNVYANSAFDVANSASSYANSGFTGANTASSYANSAFVTANSAGVYANSSFLKANTPTHVANSAASYANSAFSTANTANSTVNTKVTINSLNFLSAPSANTQNTIFLVVDLDTGTPTTKKMSLSVLTDRSANSAGVYANSAFAAANSAAGAASASSYANSAFLSANTPSHVANSAASYANSSFLTANTPSHVANSAASYANSAFGSANVASSYANSAFLTANTPNHVANSASSYANGAFTSANASSNLALSFSSTTILEVTNSGSGYYIFSQYDSLQNPNVSTFSATTLGFKLNVSGHPFHIRLGDNTADYNTGLVHVDTTGTLSYGSSAQGKVSGTLFWRIPHDAVGNYKYRCVNHPSVMIGNINVANTAAVYFAYSS
jgi:hypothetical protein